MSILAQVFKAAQQVRPYSAPALLSEVYAPDIVKSFPYTMEIPGVQSGSTLIGLFTNNTIYNRYVTTVADQLNGAWSILSEERIGNASVSAVCGITNSFAGTLQVTWTFNNTTNTNASIWIGEFATSTIDDYGSSLIQSNVNTYFGAQPGLNVAANSALVAIYGFNNNITTNDTDNITPPAWGTVQGTYQQGDAYISAWVVRGESAAPLTAETGTCSHIGTARNAYGAMASLGSVGGPTFLPAWAAHATKIAK